MKGQKTSGEAAAVGRPMMPSDRRPTVALALGGGGARGLAHIHAIEVLDELGLKPAIIAGSSIGAIMGAGMAAGMRGSDIRAYVHAVLGRRAEVASRMWRARPGSFGEFVAGGFRVSQFNIERILAAFLPDQLPARFADLDIPLRVTATDYFAHRTLTIEEGDLVSALAASAAIPALFRPVRRKGRLLIDGGICNPLPFDLLEGEADVIIAVDVVGAPQAGERQVPNTLDLIFGATQLMMQAITSLKLKQCQPTILIRPPVSRFRALDFLKVDAILGATAGMKDELKRALNRVMTESQEV
jgi:NTE family protein